MVVKKGDAVVVSTAAANWDDRVFAHPEKLDFDRDARHQLAFGHGIHRRIAQNLARVELEIVFNTLFAWVPGLRLAMSAISRRCRSRAEAGEYAGTSWMAASKGRRA